MNRRIPQGARAAILLISALSLSAYQSASQDVQSQPKCDPRTQYQGESAEAAAAAARAAAATGIEPGHCPPGVKCPDPCAKPNSQEGATTGEGTPTVDESTIPANSEDTGHEDGNGDGDGWWKALLAGAAVLGGIAAVDQVTGKDWVTPGELDANGPRFPAQQKLGRYQVQGFAAPGWPFAVDIYTEPGTRTWLELRYKGSDQSHYFDMTRPNGGRRMEVINLPGPPGAVGIARYSLRSGLPRNKMKPLYRPIRVYGLGAGPNAVGSLYLAVTAFGPAQATSPTNVSWEVAAERGFQMSLLEVLRLPKDGEGKYTLVTQTKIDLFARPRASGKWGALPMTQKIEPGTYDLQVRAWTTRSGGGDWTGAYAPNYVLIP